MQTKPLLAVFDLVSDASGHARAQECMGLIFVEDVVPKAFLPL